MNDTLPPIEDTTERFNRAELDAILQAEKDIERAQTIERFEVLTKILVSQGERVCDFSNNSAWQELCDRLEELECHGAIASIQAQAISERLKNETNLLY